LAGPEFFDEVAAAADELASRLRDYCTSMPVPGPERIFSKIYAEPSPSLAAARADHLAYHAAFAEADPGSER
jgi:pyruvate dehydrogenase E1 component alpha subunit